MATDVGVAPAVHSDPSRLIFPGATEIGFVKEVIAGRIYPRDEGVVVTAAKVWLHGVLHCRQIGAIDPTCYIDTVVRTDCDSRGPLGAVADVAKVIGVNQGGVAGE